MNVERAATWSLTLSLLLHALVLGIGLFAVSVQRSPRVMADYAPAADSWVGETFDIETGLRSVEPERAGRRSETGLEPKEPPSPAPKPDEPPSPAPKPVEPEPETTAQPPPVEPAVPRFPTSPEPTATTPSPEISPPPSASGSAAAAVARPALSGTAASAHASASSRAAVARPAERAESGSFGAAGRRRGVRNLAAAFTRAMPIANSGDPVWSSLPLGAAGSVDLTLEVGEAGKIVAAQPVDAARAPEHLIRLVQRSLSLLRAGRFALSSTQAGAGTETYRLEAKIEQVESPPAEDSSSAGPYALGFKAPRPGLPGHATFTLRTGRRITVVVTLLER